MREFVLCVRERRANKSVWWPNTRARTDRRTDGRAARLAHKNEHARAQTDRRTHALARKPLAGFKDARTTLKSVETPLLLAQLKTPILLLAFSSSSSWSSSAPPRPPSRHHQHSSSSGNNSDNDNGSLIARAGRPTTKAASTSSDNDVVVVGRARCRRDEGER
jgi:hypothetical protein